MATKTTNTAPLRFIDASILFLNPENPRTDMGDLSELVASIQAHGILQPLLVRQVDGAYMVIDGSCRLAAGLQAGLTTFPCHEVPEAEELPEDDGEDVQELREELEECQEEEPEEEEPAPVFVPQWKRRKEYADCMREILCEKSADDIRDTSLLRFVAETYRASDSDANSLDALNDGKCILACNIDDIKRALLVDIVGEFVAIKDFGDDDEAVGYWEQFKDAFGISEEEVQP